MNWWDSLSLGLAVGADPFALGLGVGSLCFPYWRVVRMGLWVGAFHCLMALLGWLLGHHLAALLNHLAPWLACAVVGALGVKLCVDHWRGNAESRLLSGRQWCVLCLVTSLDAFGVGFGLGVFGSHLWLSIVSIGFFTCLMAIAAMLLAARLSALLGRRIGLACGLLMLLMAGKLLLV